MIIGILLGISNLILLFLLNKKLNKHISETKINKSNFILKEDLDILIEYFEKQERYEDCALILKIKEKVQTRQLLTKLQNNE